jgi:hypothetical protein
MTYLAIATVEEFFEMAGVVILIYILLVHISEMRYSVRFAPPEAAPQSVAANIPVWRWNRVRMFLAVAIVAVNALFLSLALQIEPVTIPVAADSVPVYHGMVERFADEVLIVHMNETFNVNDPASHSVARSLLADYEEVMVIVLPAAESSILLASDQLPFEQEAITDILHRYGATNFVIFDPALVRVVVTAAPG